MQGHLMPCLKADASEAMALQVPCSASATANAVPTMFLLSAFSAISLFHAHVQLLSPAASCCILAAPKGSVIAGLSAGLNA